MLTSALAQRQRDDNKNKNFRFLRWGGAWGQRGKSPKTLFFVGNATTIKFWKCKFYCRVVVIAQAPTCICPRAKTLGPRATTGAFKWFFPQNGPLMVSSASPLQARISEVTNKVVFGQCSPSSYEFQYVSQSRKRQIINLRKKRGFHRFQRERQKVCKTALFANFLRKKCSFAHF